MSFLGLGKKNIAVNDEEKELNRFIQDCIKKAVKIQLTTAEVDELDRRYREFHDKNGWDAKNHDAYKKIQRLRAFCK